MNSFSKKAIIRSDVEWEETHKHSLGGEGFPSSWFGSYPVLVLEMDNPTPRDDRSLFTDKVYIFIERDDILALIGEGDAVK